MSMIRNVQLVVMIGALVVQGCGGGDTPAKPPTPDALPGPGDTGVDSAKDIASPGVDSAPVIEAGPDLTGAPDGGVDGGTDAPAPSGVVAGCAEAARKFCARLDSCGQLWLKAAYGDLATCHDRIARGCLADATAADTGLNGASITACAAALDSAQCAHLFNLRNIGACAFRGKRPLAGPCGSDTQCETGFCTKQKNTLCGKCAAPGGVGALCDEDSHCEAGLDCVKERCVKRQPLAGTCGENSPCGYGLYCKDAKCVAQGAAGDPCLEEDSCSLAKGLFCHPTAHVCQSIGVAKPGEACGFVGGTFVLCGGAGKCKTPDGQAQGVCLGPAGDGQACGAGAGQGRECLEPAVCVGPADGAGVCRLPSSGSCGGGGDLPDGGAGGDASSPPDTAPAGWSAPPFATTPLSGKIAGRPYAFVYGLVETASDDPTALSLDLLGYMPESVSHIPCWRLPPAGTERSKELNVWFRVPKKAGTYEFGGGRMIAGWSRVQFGSIAEDGVPHTNSTDQAKIVIDAYSEEAQEIKGSIVVEIDGENKVNGTFTAKRCGP